MALNKVTYTDNVTVIGAANLNAIQDEIIANGTNITTLSDGKVDKVTGKGLSTNDFTNEQVTKLAGIQSGANASDVAYDSTNHKLTKTINGTTSDVVVVDAEPTADSKNPVMSGGVQGALGEVNDNVEALQTSVQNLESTANQFIENGGIVEKVPYSFRKTGGSEHVGTAVVEKIVGGTVAWNQLFRAVATNTTNGVTFTPSSDNSSVTMDGTASSNAYYHISGSPQSIVDHVYLVDKDTDRTDILLFNDSGGVGSSATRITIGKAIAVKNFFIRVLGNATVSNFTIRPQIFDLTKMFGTTIADYIYTLEQTTAGAGVAYFKSMFPKDYYAYNAGELMSVQTAEKNTVGFNQWDEDWQAGSISENNGGNSQPSTEVRSRGYIPVFPSTRYYKTILSSGKRLRVFYYDANKNYIDYNTNNASFYTPSNCYYMRLCTMDTYGGEYKHDICLNLYNAEKNGTYEPYQKHTYPLDSSLTLRGIPKLDANNHIYYDGDTYEADGKVNRRYGIVDLGTLNWSYLAGSGSQINRFDSRITTKKPATSVQEYADGIICTKYVANPTPVVTRDADKCISGYTDNRIFILDSAYSSAADFKAAMSGVYLVYELATPTTEPADPFTNPQTVDSSGTEEFVDAGVEAETRDVSVPVGHESQYMIDIAGKLNNLPWDLSMIAPIENGTTASQAYAQGKFFLKNNQFCKALTSIASGATFTLGTNYEVTTVADQLFAALS